MSGLDFENIRCDKALCRIAEGDCSALDVIYETLGRRIYFLSLSHLHNDSDAEDVLSETLLEVIGSAKRYAQGSNARAWVLAIAKNLTLKKLRDRENTVGVDDCPPLESGDDPFADYEILSLLRSVLGEEEQKVVLLRFYGGYKFREIAQMNGESVESVKKRCQRAMKKLKEQYTAK